MTAPSRAFRTNSATLARLSLQLYHTPGWLHAWLASMQVSNIPCCAVQHLHAPACRLPTQSACSALVPHQHACRSPCADLEFCLCRFGSQRRCSGQEHSAGRQSQVWGRSASVAGGFEVSLLQRRTLACAYTTTGCLACALTTLVLVDDMRRRLGSMLSCVTKSC